MYDKFILIQKNHRDLTMTIDFILIQCMFN